MCLLDVALDRQWLIDRWLYALPLLDPATRLPYPDGHYFQALLSGREIVATEFGVEFCPRDVDEVTDLSRWSQANYYLVNLMKRPLIQVNSCGLYWGKQLIRDMAGAVDIQSYKHSQIQLDAAALSGSGADGSFTFTSRANNDRKPSLRWNYKVGYPERSLGTVTANRNSNTLTGADLDVKMGDIVGFPGQEARFVLRANSTTVWVDRPWSTGFVATEGFAATIPQVLLEAIGLLASIPILVTAGDLVIGAGIASLSRSIDSLSQSINTTSSAENSAYSARIKSNQDALKDIKMRVLRSFKPLDTFFV